MAKSSSFVFDAKRIEALIEKHAASGKGLHKRAVSLRGDLLRAIAGWHIDKPIVPSNLKVLNVGWGNFIDRHSDRIAYLALALYFIFRRQTSRGQAAKLAGIPLSDIDYALGLVKRAKWPIERLNLELDANTLVKSVADAHLEDLVVSLDERALEDMLLATVESYLARTDRNKY